MTDPSAVLPRRELGLCAAGLVLLLIGIAADAAGGIRHQDPVALQAAAARLQQLPATLNGWVSTESMIDPSERRMAELTGALRREYRQPETGYVVSLTVLSGAPGPMSVHPPTACFEGLGYTLTSGPIVTEIQSGDGSTVALNRASFREQNNSRSDVVRVFWGWSTDGQWEAPANPRTAFRNESSVYKLYVVDRAPDNGHGPGYAEAFLRDALPGLRSTLDASAALPAQL